MIYPRKFLVLLLSLLLVNNILFPAQEIHTFANNYEHIESLVNKYTIDVTILEIGNSEDELYSFNLAKKDNCVCIILLTNYGAESVIQKIKKENLKNIIVLEPQDLDLSMMNALSKCEHIDVSIIHDYFDCFQNQWRSATDLFLNLGNHIFFEISYDDDQSLKVSNILNYKHPNLKMIENRFRKVLFYYQTEKKFLEMARFTQFGRPKNNGLNYEIKSDFNEKLLLKKHPETVSQWVAGVNLMTFVMLRGVYPNDEIIKKEIENIEKKYPYHNDLIIGNMVIQGHTIIPIDFNDERRSASMPKMLTRALSFFNGTKERLRNPGDTVNKYYKKNHTHDKNDKKK